MYLFGGQENFEPNWLVPTHTVTFWIRSSGRVLFGVVGSGRRSRRFPSCLSFCAMALQSFPTSLNSPSLSLARDPSPAVSVAADNSALSIITDSPRLQSAHRCVSGTSLSHHEFHIFTAARLWRGRHENKTSEERRAPRLALKRRRSALLR